MADYEFKVPCFIFVPGQSKEMSRSKIVIGEFAMYMLALQTIPQIIKRPRYLIHPLLMRDRKSEAQGKTPKACPPASTPPFPHRKPSRPPPLPRKPATLIRVRSFEVVAGAIWKVLVQFNPVPAIREVLPRALLDFHAKEALRVLGAARVFVWFNGLPGDVISWVYWFVATHWVGD